MTVKALAGLFAAAVVVPLTMTGPATARDLMFKADLKAGNEVPPNDSAATGTAAIRFGETSKRLSWRITYTGMTDAPVGAHFHGPAAAGESAGVEIALEEPLTSPVVGEAVLTDAQAADLLAGKLYLNFHTAAHPDGEIRGQVVRR